MRLLDGADGPIASAVGKAAGAAATASTFGVSEFFGFRDEAVKWGQAVAAGLRDRVLGLRRFDRTQRLEAAHAVLVITSFFEAFDDLPEDELHALRLLRSEQVSVATGEWPGRTYQSLVQTLLDSPLPLPSPHVSFEDAILSLRVLYDTAADHTFAFVRNLLGRSVAVSGDDLVRAAVRRYSEGYRKLAVQVPEFAVWSAMTDAQATRHLVRELGTGLRGIAELLTGMASGGAVDAVRVGLATRYQAALDRPILTTADSPAGVELPSLADGYVNPSGRVALAGRDALPASESWWRDKPVREDLQSFVAGHLISPGAAETPLVILGQPGSGKSVLTRTLAARLPAADFLAVRVELRAVPADTSIQVQIEEALYQTLGERVTWPDLVRHADNAMPVVILDGFDELLQATGMNRADFLEQAQEFQAREAELGRPCAVVVTSRTVVADRARFPDGTPVVRLEPFDERQVETWLGVWNTANAPGLAARGLRPLQVEVALAHRDLAEQPLLLLLLALYDASGNALQRGPAGLEQVDLYARLFEDFAGREVDKHGAWRDAAQRQEAVELELRRMSAVAVAMFNRGGDVIAESDLAADLDHLLFPGDLAPPGAVGAGRALTPAQLLVGRFFFVHESKARRDTGDVERSFEFLHATFGEYLAARLIIDTLVELAEERSQSLGRRRAVYDPGYFHALTSLATVTRRAPVRDFCRGLLERLPPQQRAQCRSLVLELLPDAGFPHPRWSHQDYEPHRRPFAARHATFAANLVWFAVALSDGAVPVGELVGEPAVIQWRRLATLFYSQLEPEDQQNVWLNLRAEWRPPGVLELRHEDGADVPVYASLPWPPDDPGFEPSVLAPEVRMPADSKAGQALRRSAFVQTAIDVREYLYALMPYWELVGDGTWHDERSATTRAGVLFRLLLEPPSTEHHVDRLGAAAELNVRPVLRQLIVAAADNERAEDELGFYPRSEILAAAAELAGQLAAVDKVRRRIKW
ncbi:hypothetical protein GCM10010170_030210 [Dactylosporangium salmoneum]|uniref:AAA+ ATPase domain-containing protein n=1 Tax=Dactylosporangium salmoneum TaxID=53361 RepID=A0ABP5T350_9ACTN